MNGMKRWHLKQIEIQPLAKRILAIYFNGHEQWVKNYPIEDSCIPTTIDEEED
jgi:hypothetical protein